MKQRLAALSQAQKLLVLLCVLVTAVNLAWLVTHPTPVMTGQETPLIAARQMQDFLAHPFSQIWFLLKQNDNDHFSFYNMSAAVTSLLAGGGHFGMSLASTLYYLVLICSVFGIVRRLGNETGALAAAVSAALLPAAFAWSRLVSPNIAMMALTALGVYLLVASDWLERPTPALTAGLLVALSLRFNEAVSDNFQIALAVGCVAVYVFLVAMISPRTARKRTLAAAGGSLVVFLLALNYAYLNHAISYLLAEGATNSVSMYSRGNVRLHPDALLAYPLFMWDILVRPLFCVATLAALALLASRPSRNTGFALVYLLASLLLVTLISKKSTTYVLAMLPAMPVAIGMAVSRLPRRPAVYAVLAALALWGGFDYARLSFVDRPAEDSSLYASYAKYFQGSAAFYYPQKHKAYLPETIARQAVAAARENGGGSLLLLGGMEIELHDATTFRYLARLANRDNALRLVDPVLDVERHFGYGEVYDMPIAPFEPDFIVYFPTPNDDANVQSFLTPGWLEGQFMHVSLVMNKNRPQLVHDIAAKYETLLQAVPWNAYRVRHFEIYTPAPQLRATFYLFDRPETGKRIEPTKAEE